MKKLTALLASFAALAITQTASADPVAPDAVTFDGTAVKASLTGQPGNAENGKKWFLDQKLGNCLACHANKDMSKEQFHGEVGPALDGVAARHDEGTLRAILVNSKAVFGPETSMPGFYRTSNLSRVRKEFQDKTVLSAEQVEDVLAYLLTLKK